MPVAGLLVPALLLSWPKGQGSWNWRKLSLARLDFVGAILLLGGSALLVFTLQEAGAARFAWKSAAAISTLTISGVCWIAFFASTALPLVGLGWKSFKPIFPLSVALERPTGPTILYLPLTNEA